MKWESSSPVSHLQACAWCACTGSAYRLHRIRTCSRSTRSSRTGTGRVGGSMTFLYSFVNISCSAADLDFGPQLAGWEHSYASHSLCYCHRYYPCDRSLASPGGTTSSSPLSCSWPSASTWIACWSRWSTLDSGRCLSSGQSLEVASSRTAAEIARHSWVPMKAVHIRAATMNRSVWSSTAMAASRWVTGIATGYFAESEVA